MEDEEREGEAGRGGRGEGVCAPARPVACCLSCMARLMRGAIETDTSCGGGERGAS